MKEMGNIGGYAYDDARFNASHAYLMPAVSAELAKLPDARRRLFDLGCGNGSVSKACADMGWDVTGVDVSEDGIAQAKTSYPDLRLAYGSAYDDLADQYGLFDALISLEVVEHVYDPRHYASTVASLLAEGGTALISTPYHGYVKNLAMAVTGKMDAHFTALWDHGHIKFWSVKTLTQLLTEAGLVVDHFAYAGRVPPLAKSMIAVAHKPKRVLS
ncbi:class I SAM-dependent methyltransferase [Yoonia sp.]|uniref:class I SAM-dependent methyltransferase n=1 Tax=Yoonia sp. TaxID=2212373 RepID=UPI0035C7DAFE